MKVETRSGILWRLPHEFALCSLQFRLLSGSLLLWGYVNVLINQDVSKPVCVVESLSLLSLGFTFQLDVALFSEGGLAKTM